MGLRRDSVGRILSSVASCDRMDSAGARSSPRFIIIANKDNINLHFRHWIGEVE